MAKHYLNRFSYSVLIWLIILSPIAAAAPKFPFAYNAAYKIELSGTHVGSLVVALKSINNELWHYQSRTKPHGIFSLLDGSEVMELSYLHWFNGRLRSLAYQYDDGEDSNKRDVFSYFDWQKKQLLTQHGDSSKEYPLSDNSYDRHALTLALMHALTRGEKEFKYTVANKGDIETMQFRISGKEKLTLPYGSVDTVIVEEINQQSKYRVINWFAPELDYLMVRMEQYRKEKLKTRLSLETIKLN